MKIPRLLILPRLAYRGPATKNCWVIVSVRYADCRTTLVQTEMGSQNFDVRTLSSFLNTQSSNDISRGNWRVLNALVAQCALVPLTGDRVATVRRIPNGLR